MKKTAFLLLLLLCAALCAACDKAQPDGPAPLSALQDETFTLPAALSELTAAETADAADVTCVPLERDGKRIGFEMRLPQTAGLNAMLSDQQNTVFGAVQSKNKQIAIPMELIRILPDTATHEFVLTLLLPSGETVSGKTCSVAFYAAARSDPTGNVLYCAQKEIKLS